MAFNRRGGDRRTDRPDRRPGGDWRPREPRPFRNRGDRPRGGDQDRPLDRDRGVDRDRGGAYGPRRFERADRDEGGMSLRLDPRRLGTLKRLAAEAGLRPGELALQWIEERIDGGRERQGTPSPAPDVMAAVTKRLDDLAARLSALEAGGGRDAGPTGAQVSPSSNGETPEQAVPKRRGRPPGSRNRSPGGSGASARRGRGKGRIALHDEIIAIIAERGPSTAGEIATAIAERGRYRPPRSGKPLDASLVNGRVSNPTYRTRFTRSEGHRIGLAQEG